MYKVKYKSKSGIVQEKECNSYEKAVSYCKSLVEQGYDGCFTLGLNTFQILDTRDGKVTVPSIVYEKIKPVDVSRETIAEPPSDSTPDPNETIGNFTDGSEDNEDNDRTANDDSPPPYEDIGDISEPKTDLGDNGV